MGRGRGDEKDYGIERRRKKGVERGGKRVLGLNTEIEKSQKAQRQRKDMRRKPAKPRQLARN